jgi:hypothetical protein
MKKISQEKVERLSPGVANSDALACYLCLEKYCNFSLYLEELSRRIKSSEHSKNPIFGIIQQELNSIYQEQYDEAATEDITVKDTDKAMINFPGDSTFPSWHC